MKMVCSDDEAFLFQAQVLKGSVNGYDGVQSTVLASRILQHCYSW